MFSPSFRARLERLVEGSPEVVVKVTGRTYDLRSLRSNLEYISRNGRVRLEDRDGLDFITRSEVFDRIYSWVYSAALDSCHRANSPLSHSIVLSMPAGTEPKNFHAAARSFAAQVFSDKHDYLFALHTDTGHPHVHLTVRSRSDDGRHLNPRKGDLEYWRQTFAQALRDRGVDAEASPRFARGVTRKAERGALLRIRQRSEAGFPKARVVHSAYMEAAGMVFQGVIARSAWEKRIWYRQYVIRRSYLFLADQLKSSGDLVDKVLGRRIEAFVTRMPAPDTQRLALARELKEVSRAAKTHRWSKERDRNR